MVMCVEMSFVGSSTSRKLSSDEDVCGGRRRKYTSNSDIDGLAGGSILKSAASARCAIVDVVL